MTRFSAGRTFRLAAFLGSVVGASACGEDSRHESTDSADSFERRFSLAPSAEVWLIAVAAADHVAATELRQAFASAFEQAAARTCGHHDPAAWAPVQRIAVVAYPSANGTVFVGPEHDRALTHRSNTTDAGLSAWAAAVASTIRAPPPTTGPNSILAALADGIGLLAGTRAPTSELEQQLVEAAAPGRDLVVALLSSEEDESTGAPADYAVPVFQGAGRFRGVAVAAAIVPRAMSASCVGECPASEAFTAWRLASGSAFALAPWPEEPPGHINIGSSCGTIVPSCVPQPARHDSGQVACRLFVESRSASPCAAEHGWFESTEQAAASQSMCEVRQLEGSALEACRTDLDCVGCEPGFCFTDVPALARDCEDSGQAMYPRVIPGPLGASPEGFRLTCEAP